MEDNDTNSDLSYEEDDFSLIAENITSSSTDTITDLKTGIYSLFVSLFHEHVPLYGPEGAIQITTDFLEEIIVNFRQSIADNN